MSSDQENPLLFDVLTGSSSSFTANPDEQTLNEVIDFQFISIYTHPLF